MNYQKISFSKRLALNIFKRYRKVQAQLHELNYFFWECTLRCNISCLHCGSDCKADNKIPDMPADDFLKVTKSLKKQYNPNKVMIVITGGEPLMRKDLEYVGAELYKQGYPWGFVTNGFLLTKERLNNLLNAGLSSVTVSLDGFEEDHDWLRGRKQSFIKAVEAIKQIVATPDLVYDVVTCVNKKNFFYLADLKDFLISIGVVKWRLFMIDPIGRAAQLPDLIISDEQFVGLMNFIKSTNEEGKIKASFGCDGFLGSFENVARDGYFFCRAGINIASVLADGAISICPNNSRHFIQGNIYQDDFLTIWNTKFEPMRNRTWTKKGICKECKIYSWCEGSGLHLHRDCEQGVLLCHYNMLR